MDFLKSALSGNQNDLLSVVMSVIGGQKDGLSGLVSQFGSNGVEDLIQSWIGIGDNKSISASQLTDVLGADKIGEIASKMGTDSDSVLSQLIDILPQAVDKLTPDGSIPEDDILSKGADLIGGLFK